MEATEFDRELKERTQLAENILKAHLPEETGLQKKIIEAMNYSLMAGGKRLRPILMRETYRMCGGEGGPVIECFMAAIEMIHTYSLVHDDLPAMDNDRYRRGRETTWYVYGEAMGILAGDGLLNYAFETALKALQYCLGTPEEGLSETGRLPAVNQVSHALSVLSGKAGIYGMIGGQTADIMAEAEDIDRLLFIHEHKTAALIQASMMIGAILAGASKEQVSRIEKCAYNIGVAFQIQDDILDVIGDSGELGKPTGSDAQNHKQTYVTLKGLEHSRTDVETLSREAVEVLDTFEGEHEFLRQLIMALIHRRA